ncbi:MAG: ScyD/ScyE family protein [Caldilineaceae bacterium]
MSACASAPSTAPAPGALPDLSAPSVTVVVDGLFGPLGLETLADGSLLVAEEGTGQRDDSAGVSLITPDGTVGRFISGLPSTRDAGDLAGVPLVKLSPDGTTLYVGNFGVGHLWTYTLSADEQAHGIALPAVPLTTDDLGTAMARLNNVMLINPFDMTFDAAGVPVVADASGNGVAKENANGTTRFIHRFDQLPNPVMASDTIEAVPTGITRVDDEYWVTLTGGCPYPAGGGQLVAIDEARNQRTIVDGLNMPIDVAVGPDGTVAGCWSSPGSPRTPIASAARATRPRPAASSRLRPDGTLETVIDHLNFPGAVFPVDDGSLYISEVLPGRGSTSPSTAATVRSRRRGRRPHRRHRAAHAHHRHARHAARLVADQGLTPNPGADQQEDDTPAAQLGQLLFFDPILSGDKNISCATCLSSSRVCRG